MQRGHELDKQVYDQNHIDEVLVEIHAAFPRYFDSFGKQPLEGIFDKAIQEHEETRKQYLRYMDISVLDAFGDDPSAFKRHTRTNCPIIRAILNADDEAFNDFKRAFNETTGLRLLKPVRAIADFALDYASRFDDQQHENIVTYQDFGLDPLNQGDYGHSGVIGYGVQSMFLYALYPHAFAHRSQAAVWSLYFLSNHKDFGLLDGSEFIISQPAYNTVEQNYFYPADLFAFYMLKVYLLLKAACMEKGIKIYERSRYIYLDKFCDHIAACHRSDITYLSNSSQYVEEHWHG